MSQRPKLKKTTSMNNSNEKATAHKHSQQNQEIHYPDSHQSTQGTSDRQEDNFLRKYRRSIKLIASSVLMVIVSSLPYLDVFLNQFFDLSKIKMNSFANCETAIWSFSICISPLLVLAVSKLKPWWFAYIVTFYVNITMFLGFLFLEINVDISSVWLFRFISFGLSLLLLVFCKLMMNYSKVLILKDKVNYEIERIQR